MKLTKRDHIDIIVGKHGCELMPRRCIRVLPRYQEGWPRDQETIANARAEVEAHYPGATKDWVS